MTTPPSRAFRQTMNRSKPNFLALLLTFFAIMIAFMVVLLHRLLHLDVNCENNNKDCGTGVPVAAAAVSTISSNSNSQQLPASFKSSYVPPSSLSEWKFDYFGPDELIQSYNPGLHPVSTTPASVKKLKVRLFTEVFNENVFPMNECKHILYDGLIESEALDFLGTTYTSNNEPKQGDFEESWKDDDLWVLDSHHVLESCDIILKWAQQTQELKGKDKPWLILAVDYGDSFDQLYQCDKLAAAFPSYRIAKRSIGMNRKWSETAQFPTLGMINPQPLSSDKPVLHLPYPVRTDVARGLAQAIQQMGLKSPLDISDRQIDVSHFYARQANVAIKAYYDNLRNGINVVLKFMDQAPLSNGRRIQIFAGLAGKDRKMGRNIVSSDYLDVMLKSKIIVVAQRDGWSDHYRTMEALSSGAMILADDTVVLPRGLRHGESLVIYSSFSDLREKLLYYLEHDAERILIAKRGWEIAMGYHRSWHAMESVIFGSPVTNVGDAMAAFAKDLAEREEPAAPAKRKRGRVGGI